MPAASESSELYRDHQSSVSPTWLINGKSRYAVKTLVKLEFHTITQPRVRASFMLLLGTVLTLMSFRYIMIGAQPQFIPFIMLAGSVTLMAGGACVLYLARPRFRIDMALVDGSCVSLLRKKKTDAESLLAGLSDAMDWHRSAELENLPRTNRSRQVIARSSERPPVEPQGLSTSKAVVKRPVVSPVMATEPVTVKAQFAPLLRLLSTRRHR